MANPYQPKTGQRCGCKRGVQRDNCPTCEGTGWVIDFQMVRWAVQDELAKREQQKGKEKV